MIRVIDYDQAGSVRHKLLKTKELSCLLFLGMKLERLSDHSYFHLIFCEKHSKRLSLEKWLFS